MPPQLGHFDLDVEHNDFVTVWVPAQLDEFGVRVDFR
jgi:hypothetical protein